MALNIRKQDKMMLSRLSVLLYGFPKIGKTTEAAKLPGALILNCEPGGTDLLKDIEVMDVHNLSEFERTVDEIARSNYKAIVVDGFTWMINQAAKNEAAKPGMHGMKAYGVITDRVTAAMSKLLDSGKVVIATGHSRLVDSTEGTKDKRDVRPDLNEALADDIFGVFSIICYCYPTPGGSKMLTKPSDNDARRIYAGDRSGVLPVTMPLDLRKVLELLKGAAGEDKPAAPAVNGAAKPVAVAVVQPAQRAPIVELNGEMAEETTYAGMLRDAENGEQPQPDGDNPFAPADVDTQPTDYPADWRGPVDAQMWAVKDGHCANDHEARNSWLNTLKEHKGFDKTKAPQVYASFYAKHMERAKKQLEPAGPDVGDGENMPMAA